MKLNNESLQLLNIFENLTHSSVKDCFIEDNKIIYVVNNGNLVRALGPHGRNIKKIENILKRKIKVVEFSDDPINFVKSYLSPLRINEINIKNSLLEIKSENNQQKGILIGRDKKNLINLKDIVRKYFKSLEIKIL